ncbi:hypothetical protein [Streptomyces sp. NPDC059256]|uniref:hypothetical protein n=1 Tax=Streptomyces sp. NPDC059256 TaxID=3346794 RepID=UPI00368CEDE7
MPQTRRLLLPPLLAALLVSGAGALTTANSDPQSSAAAPRAGSFAGVPEYGVLGDHHAPVPPRRP